MRQSILPNAQSIFANVLRYSRIQVFTRYPGYPDENKVYLGMRPDCMFRVSYAFQTKFSFDQSRKRRRLSAASVQRAGSKSKFNEPLHLLKRYATISGKSDLQASTHFAKLGALARVPAPAELLRLVSSWPATLRTSSN